MGSKLRKRKYRNTYDSHSEYWTLHFPLDSSYMSSGATISPNTRCEIATKGIYICEMNRSKVIRNKVIRNTIPCYQKLCPLSAPQNHVG